MIALAMLSTVAFAGSDPIFDTFEGELRYGAGGGSVGAWTRASHTWKKGAPALRTGVALSYYTGSEDWEEAVATTEGRVSDVHLDLHFTPVFRPGRKDRLAIETGMYVGGYWFRSKGTWSQPELGIEETYVTNAFLPDIGFRLAFGWRVAPGWTVQASLNDSLRRVDGAQGVLGGLLTLDADAKLSMGLGVTWRPGAAE